MRPSGILSAFAVLLACGDGTAPRSAPTGPYVMIQRADAAAECDDLLPDVAAPPVVISVPGPRCGPAVVDGAGHAAVRGSAATRGTWHVFDAHGAEVGTFETDPTSPILPEPSGWQVLLGGDPVDRDEPQRVTLATVSPAGEVNAKAEIGTLYPDETIAEWDVRQDPLGGAALALRWRRHVWSPTPSRAELRRYDPAGALRGAPGVLSMPAWIAASGVSNHGESAVLLVDDETDLVRLDWMGADGGLLGSHEQGGYWDAFTELGTPGATLIPLLDGSLVLRAGGRYTRRFARLADRYGDPPEWLAARAGWTLRFTRGNRGYALFPGREPPRAGCEQAMELRAPSGRLCGTIAIREVERGECSTAYIDQGWDGTLVQQSPRDACSFRLWPRLLARP